MKRFTLGAMFALSLTLASTAASAADAQAAANAAPAAAPAQNGGAAQTYVDGLAQQVLAIVKDSGTDKVERTKKIEALFTDKVDMDFIARFVLGKAWRAATPEQQQAYITAYKPFLLKNYASRLAKYSGQTYSLKKTRNDGNASVVTMEIQDTNGQSFLVDYRLREQGGNFKVLDIIVEGVSLLSTQRSEFASIIDQKGIDGLTEALKKQVAAKSGN